MATMPFELVLILAKQHDRQALGDLYTAFNPRISSYVHYCIHLDYIADDIIAEVFTKMVSDIHTLHAMNERSFHAWLHRIAHDKIMDYYRSSNARRTDGLAKREIISPDDPTKPIEIQERNTILHDAIRKLPTDAYKIVVGRIVQGLPVRTVSEMVGKSETAVRKIQERALYTLRRMIQPLLTLLVAGALLTSGGGLIIYLTSRATPKDSLHPVKQVIFPAVTPTPTLAPIAPTLPMRTPTPSPTPTPAPVPVSIPVSTDTPTPTATPTPAPTSNDGLHILGLRHSFL